MGGLCSKAERNDNFAGPGRVLGSAPAQRTNAPVPSAVSKPAPKPSNTVTQGSGQVLGSSNTADNPREAAARAAEARATKQQGQGKLADQLAAQKKGGMQAALKDASYENQRQREADASQEARNWS